MEHKRKTGLRYTIALAIGKALSLDMNATCLFAQPKENTRDVDYVLSVVKKEFALNLTYKPAFAELPNNNRRLIFDDLGEPIGIEILEKKKVFQGYYITVK